MQQLAGPAGLEIGLITKQGIGTRWFRLGSCRILEPVMSDFYLF